MAVNSLRMLSVGEVARRAGVAVSTLHFYEKMGLIASVRTSGNQRQFPAHVLRYVAVIKVAQRAGIPLKEIKQALDAYPSDGKLAAGQWRDISTQWRDNLNDRIIMLTRLRDELDGCIGCGCLSLEDCPLRNPADKFGEQGPGAGILERE